jgi:hypothetical protein
MSEWDRIDDLILGGVTLFAIREIRVQAGCSLQEAIERYHERAVLLHETRPGDFKSAQDGVSDGFHP